MRRKTAVALLAAVPCLCLSACNKQGKQNGVTQTGAPSGLYALSYLNQRAPAIDAEQWLPKKPDTDAKFVLVQLSREGCDGCKAMLPMFDAFQREFVDQLAVIDIVDAAPAEAVGQGHTYITGIDSQLRLAREIKLQAFPHVMLIDPVGIVRWEGCPFSGLRVDQLRLTSELIRQLIDQHGSARQS